MGARWVRVVLIVGMLVTMLASVGTASADRRSERIADLSDLTFDGYAGALPEAGRTHVFDPSEVARADIEARWRAHNEEYRTPQVVVGNDSRIQVTDTTIFPYSAIAQLVGIDDNMPENTVSTCTGAFVGPNVLLTAAHCLWSEEWDGWIDGMALAPGANGDQTPFGIIVPSAIWIPDSYVTNSAPGSPYDYGLIVLDSTSTEAATGSFEIGILKTSELTDPAFNATTSGYPGDKPAATQWISSEASFAEVTDDGLIHLIDSFQGQSGSPVWRGSDYTVVGVESADNDFENLAVRLDIPIIYELAAACQELGCRLNHYLTDYPGDTGAYDRVWARTDQAVASATAPRTWMWGPAPLSKVMLEPYAEAPNGFRTVLYQEKSRMEITAPASDPNSIWYVTNGLATVELMTGRLQLGDNTFEQYQPAEINVAGDQGDPNAPTYVTFAGLRSLPPHGGSAGPGPIITATVDRAGTVGDDPSLASYGVTADYYVETTGHRVAAPFWGFMKSTGTVWQNGQYVTDVLFSDPFFATGLPITEAYWATVQVGGTPRTVLVQAFERRVLTYTPGNPEGFVVEAGNVGAHYHHWRYNLIPLQLPGPPPGGEPPIDPPPAVGELLAQADFATWPELETTFGDVGMPVGDSYQITNPPTGFMQVVPNDVFGDGYFSVEARATQTSAAGIACLVYRADVNDENPLFNDFGYWFCLYYEDGQLISALTVYETTAGIVELGGAEFIEPLPPASDWHQMGVVARGAKFWFEVDGVIIGSITHDLGPGAGSVGILSINLDDADGAPDATYQFRNLRIYALAP